MKVLVEKSEVHKRFSAAVVGTFQSTPNTAILRALSIA